MTAEEVIEKYIDYWGDCQKEDIIKACIEYAKEAIKEDRKNVAEKASLIGYFEEWDENGELKMDDDDNLDAHYSNPYLGAGRIIAINKNSIINAPMIELK